MIIPKKFEDDSRVSRPDDRREPGPHRHRRFHRQLFRRDLWPLVLPHKIRRPGNDGLPSERAPRPPARRRCVHHHLPLLCSNPYDFGEGDKTKVEVLYFLVNSVKNY